MERIGREVERTLARSGGRKALVLSEITAAWPKVVGDVVARHAWPLRVARDGTLHVAASSATWAFELDRLSPQILERASVVLGTAAPPKLRFWVGPVPEPGGVTDTIAEARGETLRVSVEASTEAASAAAAIEDSELRAVVERAARASLTRARSGRRFW